MSTKVQKIDIEALPVTDQFLRQKRLIQDRGELALIEDGTEIRHLGYFSLREGSGYFRGGHYHQKKTERFYVIAGSLTLQFVDVQSGKSGELQVDAGTRVTIHPQCAHRFIAREEAQVIEYCDSIYDPEDDLRYDFNFE